MESCAEGRLLMISDIEYSNTPTFNREVCNRLNDLAKEIADLGSKFLWKERNFIYATLSQMWSSFFTTLFPRQSREQQDIQQFLRKALFISITCLSWLLMQIEKNTYRFPCWINASRFPCWMFPSFTALQWKWEFDLCKKGQMVTICRFVILDINPEIYQSV